MIFSKKKIVIVTATRADSGKLNALLNDPKLNSLLLYVVVFASVSLSNEMLSTSSSISMLKSLQWFS